MTVRDGNYEAHDPSLLRHLDRNLKVFRAFTLERFLKGYSHSIDKRVKVVKPNSQINRARKFAKRIWVSLYHFAGQFLGVPDAHILWLPHAFLTGLRIILTHKCEVIYSTGPSFTDHVLALLLKKETKKSLIVDFRDAWIANPSYAHNHKIRRKIELFLEKSVILNSHIVVSTTRGMTDDFKKRYAQADPEKFVTITNGFDLDDFPSSPAQHKKNDKFSIVHTGILGFERTPKFFLEALKKLIEDKPSLEKEIEVVLVGKNLRFDDNKEITDYLKDMDLGKVVRVMGFVPRHESLVYQHSADLLLLIIGIVPYHFLQTYGLSGKAFDYALSGKPILALAQEGATAEFVKKTNIGFVLPPDDSKTIKDGLEEIIMKFKRGELILRPNRKELQRYDLRNLTRELARYMDNCVN